MEYLKFDWQYAGFKILVFLTSTTNLAILAGACTAIFGFELSEQVQATVVVIAGAAMAVLNVWKKQVRA